MGSNSCVIFDDSENTVLIRSQADVTDLLERNKQLSNHVEQSGEMPLAAGVDMVTFARLLSEGIMQDPVRLNKWLNDPDNRACRTDGGKRL